MLKGAYDMHAHGHPQFSLNQPCRLDDYDWGKAAAAAGMAGFVIKSHMWPTMSSAYMVNQAVEGITAYGSLTINDISGGLNPVYVQIAAEEGAKVIFMPTWSGVNDINHGCLFFNRMRPLVTRVDRLKEAKGIYLLDENDQLLPEVKEIIQICKEYDIVLASGHITAHESMKLAEGAAREGTKFVFTHPLLAPLIDASVEQMKEVAAMGGYIEHVFIGCMPMHQRMDPRRIYNAICEVGPEHTVMSSDAIEGWNPPEPEVLRMFIGSMMTLGIPEKDIYTMTHTNPAYLLGAPKPPTYEEFLKENLEA